MENANLYRSVYPGEYVPLLNDEEIKDQLKLHDNDIIEPLINITELADSFKIEAAIPGFQRGEFHLNAIGNVLTICAVPEKDRPLLPAKMPLSEFNKEFYFRHITLPENADPEFSTAMYKAGILLLYVSKTKCTVKESHTRIVVY